MSFATGWVRSPQVATGQDHLGVLATSENLYGQLISGITNSTERARLYSFYPWIFWAYRQQGLPEDAESVRMTLRRAECLLTLIAARHGDHLGLDRNHDREHGYKLVGRRRLLPELTELEQGETVSLDDLSKSGDEGGYFQNPWGGFGQNYAGQLVDLDLLEFDGDAYVVTEGVGDVVAQAYDSTVSRQTFFQALRRGKLSLSVLDRLTEFCPCALAKADDERAVLLDAFFNKPGPFETRIGESRRSTLGVILDLAAAQESHGSEACLDIDTFCVSCYADVLPGGELWEIPPLLATSREGWRYFWFGELVSVAVQSLFWAALSSVGADRCAASTRSLAEEALRRHYPIDSWQPDLSFAAAVELTASELPERNDWEASGHEIQLAWLALNCSRDGDVGGAVQNGLGVLIALAGRAERGDIPSLAGFQAPNEYAGDYSINPRRFLIHVAHTWRNMTVREFALWILTWWGMDAHIRVALRKLRYSSRDTFQVRPVESGILVEGAPQPGFSSPRFRQAVQILRDLGALDPRDEQDAYSLTASGRCLLGEVRG